MAVLFADFPGAARYAGRLPGLDVVVLPGIWGAGRFLQNRMIRQAVTALRRLLRTERFGSLHVSHDERPEGQAAVRWFRRHAPDAPVHLVEDGLGAYLPVPRWSPAARAVRLLWAPLRSAWTGTRWRPRPGLGAFGAYDGVWLSHPGLARPDLRRLPLHAIPRPDAAATRAWREAATARIALDGTWRDAETLVLLDHPEAGPTPRAVADRETVPGEGHVAVKPHPRDPDPALPEGARVVPAGLAAEILPSLAPSLRHVVGGRSMALLATRWARPDVRVVSWIGLQDGGGGRLAGLFRAAGVEVPEDLPGFRDALRGRRRPGR